MIPSKKRKTPNPYLNHKTIFIFFLFAGGAAHAAPPLLPQLPCHFCFLLCSHIRSLTPHARFILSFLPFRKNTHKQSRFTIFCFCFGLLLYAPFPPSLRPSLVSMLPAAARAQPTQIQNVLVASPRCFAFKNHTPRRRLVILRRAQGKGRKRGGNWEPRDRGAPAACLARFAIVYTHRTVGGLST